MSTRLDRLFLLLDTGSTPLIRKSAAEQLGEVQKLHPYELNNLLSKVHGYLRSPNWETRIAAGQAVEAIARNVPKWEAKLVPKQEPQSDPSCVQSPGQLLFAQFDLNKVLNYGASLVGSEEKMYEVDNSTTQLADKEQLSRQRQMLNKRLGLDVAGNLGLGIGSDIFTDDDLIMGIKSSNGVNTEDQKSVSDIVKQQLLLVTGGMSAREKNRVKRKAKILAKQRSKECQSEQMTLETEPPCKKAKSRNELDLGSDGKLVMESSNDNTLNMEEVEEWPFETFCELLMNDLFQSTWESRHGAATGLREVIKLHGQSAGMSVDTPADQVKTINQVWLSDLGLRLVCVIALDRFGDYVSDEVVAPVRETCAQTLGVVVRCLEPWGVEGVVHILLQLLAQRQWEVRHGGLLGFKYLLAIRKDMTDKLLPATLPCLFQGLQDISDDVRAVAAAALVPVADSVVSLLPGQVPLIVASLWHTLLDLDDLTSSTNSIMTLLSTIMAHPRASVLDWLTTPLTDLVPRLWPFLRHNIASVRKSALQTFSTLLDIESVQHPTNAWLPLILQDVLRHLIQRSLLEERHDVLITVGEVWSKLLSKTPIEHLIAMATPWLGVWLSLCMQPSKVPFEPTYLIQAKHRGRLEVTSGRQRVSGGQEKEQQDYIASTNMLNSDVRERDTAVMKARMHTSRLLGILCSYITREVPNYPLEAEKPIHSLSKLFLFHMNNKSAIQRFIVGQVLYYWASVTKDCPCTTETKSKLLECLNEAIYFDEIAASFTHMQSDCQNFIAGLKQQGIDMDSIIPPGSILSVEQASSLTSTVYDQVKITLKPNALQTFEDRRKQLRSIVEHTTQELQTLTVRVQVSLAKAVVMMDILPDKLNPVIRPLMDCIKKESNINIQREAGDCLLFLIQKCVGRSPSPNGKVVKNLCGFLCGDPSFTPKVESPAPPSSESSPSNEVPCRKHTGILTLTKQQKVPDNGRKWLRRTPSVKVDVDIPADVTHDNVEAQRQLNIQRRGADLSLNIITRQLGDKLPNSLPQFWETVSQPLSRVPTDVDSHWELKEDGAEELVHSLQVLECVCASLDPTLVSQIVEKLPNLLTCLQCSYTAVRHMAARCVGALSRVMTSDLMTFCVESVIPFLGASDQECQRQGAVEALSHVIEQMGVDLLPYIVLLVVPILGRMSDQNDAVRLLSTNSFASLIRLLPLEASIPDPPEMNPRLAAQKEMQRKFLEQLMDCSKVESYQVSVPVDADLRKYQQKNKIPDCAPLSSIVICPPTLIGHWVYEVQKFVDQQYLNPLMYAGPPSERVRLQKRVKKHNLIVASYDVVRNDIEFFSTINWNYCILDEGHIIKNGKTKLSKAVKQLQCNHRLVLTGTPIQNNVLDLWSLFDFLMPGFLGTEKQFQGRYGKPILQSRDAKSTSKEQEAGALAMESLHRQVLPFILRRLKEDVLQDLPPKIIQDYYCDLSPLQVELYEDFAKSQAKKGVEDMVTSLKSESPEKKVPTKGSTHVFQALQYLRKVCNHPSLVLTPAHPKYEQITSQLKKQNTNLRDILHAPKLNALRQLLMDCGIGVDQSMHVPGQQQVTSNLPVVNQHRVLLFCQLKGMLNIVEKDLLRTHMPGVTYLRLDGSIPAGSRHNIVNRFNNDPSIDLLLLTTHVGGLGLNLTGADTVIFVEHDWNPMKDLQAMDRAHRIGQKKVVNVYRLVTRGTLEEKIMGLQKFKMTIANTVISQENSSLQTMGTDQLLDLFSLDDEKKGQSASGTNQAEAGSSKKETVSSMLENLGDLWDEDQYDTEYDMTSFLNSLST
ncbi:TATA-binding protein-associated factor 172-like isoform X2 [Ylistrum balloti]|uniref:TATA-binding protein-associated factor 172-like isoform X2 n=1 Tax=Ylistrum balloti TaxID=509963 RepID=UPI00290583CB|nr:TATA-binding protein-associated factor 172-like isoform X2 [Ylistrum balloti]